MKKIVLPSLKPVPSPLKELLTSIAKEFRNNIRGYNSSLSFASLGIQFDKTFSKNGVYIIRIHGNILKNYLLRTLTKYLYLYD